MRRLVALGVVLFWVWLLWSGHYTFLLIGLGAASCVAILLIVRRMNVVDHESVALHLVLPSLGYLPWLLVEIVRANLDVAWRIVHPRAPIAPRIVHARSTQRTMLGRVIFANSITLTPGTVSIRLLQNEILVHALTREAAEGLATGRMDRRVSRLEGSA